MEGRKSGHPSSLPAALSRMASGLVLVCSLLHWRWELSKSVSEPKYSSATYREALVGSRFTLALEPSQLAPKSSSRLGSHYSPLKPSVLAHGRCLTIHEQGTAVVLR